MSLVLSVQWASYSIYIEKFFDLSQLNTSLLLVLFPIPLTLSDAIFRFIVLQGIEKFSFGYFA